MKSTIYDVNIWINKWFGFVVLFFFGILLCDITFCQADLENLTLPL